MENNNSQYLNQNYRKTLRQDKGAVVLEPLIDPKSFFNVPDFMEWSHLTPVIPSTDINSYMLVDYDSISLYITVLCDQGIKKKIRVSIIDEIYGFDHYKAHKTTYGKIVYRSTVLINKIIAVWNGIISEVENFCSNDDDKVSVLIEFGSEKQAEQSKKKYDLVKKNMSDVASPSSSSSKL